jgi:tetratricopeptide (TPR) repeat protein
LINEFLKNTKQEKQVTILAGSCLSNAAAPYLPFIEAFTSYISKKENNTAVKAAEDINAWLSDAKRAEKSGEYGNLTPQAWKDLTFAEVAKALSTLSNYEPLIFLIEDLHWADSASLSLLHFVARTLRSEKVLLVSTFRGEELTTDAEGQAHPLVEELRMMRREDLYTEINLSNFDLQSVSEIANNMMEGKINRKLATKLMQESRGNALFVVESLRMLSERGNLYLENDEWCTPIESLSIPDKFKDIIMHRLSLLKFNQRRVVDAASVIGEKFDVDLLSTVLGQDSLEVLETLNTIARSTSLFQVEENYFRFDHAKSRQAIYEEITAPLKKGYHKRVAEKLEHSSAETSMRLPFSQIAYHYAEADSKEKAQEFALAAGEDALSRFSNIEAIKHFTYVLQTVPDQPTNSEVKNKALEGLGDAYYANGYYKKAAETFENLAKASTGRVRLRAYRKAMDGIYFGNPPPMRGHVIELAKQAEPYFSDDRLEAARILMIKSPLGTEKRQELDAALMVFEEEFSLPDITRALAIRTFFEKTSSVKRALNSSLRALAMQKEFCGDSVSLALSIEASWQVFLEAGLMQEAWEKLSEEVIVGEKAGNFHHIGIACVTMSRFLEIWGKTEEGIAMSLKAINALKNTDGVRRQDREFADLSRQYAKLGDLAQAEEYAKQLSSQVPTTILGDPQGLLNKRDRIRTQAVLFAANNRWSEAYQYLEEALELAKKILMFPIFSQLVVRTDYIWVLNRQGRTEEAQVHLEEIKKLYDKVEREFAAVSIDANILAPRNVVVGEKFEIRLDLFNVSRRTGLLVKVDKLTPAEFKFTNSKTGHTADSGSVDLKKEKIEPFEVKTIKLTSKALKPGVFNLNPQVTYIDETGKDQICESNTITMTVKSVQTKFETMPGRLTTGFESLDELLYGGIPQCYAVVLAASSSAEREEIVAKFLEVGAKSGERTIYVTIDSKNLKTFAKNYLSNFFMLLCNPHFDASLQNQPNIIQIKGTENLTEIGISLVKLQRQIPNSNMDNRRICLEIVSDVLLQHHAVATRRWLSGLLANLRAEGFTVFAIVDPQMHAREELQAVLGLFEGEIQIVETNTTKGVQKILKIKRLLNQKFSDKEIIM